MGSAGSIRRSLPAAWPTTTPAGHDRPGYGGSTPQPDRTVADAAADVAALADQLQVGRFAVWGASGGGPHALACAALLLRGYTETGVIGRPSLASVPRDGRSWTVLPGPSRTTLPCFPSAPSLRWFDGSAW
jgi:pimeloyl-ACP methyl ester carboxylesterase